MGSQMKGKRYAGKRIDAAIFAGAGFDVPEYIHCNVSNTYSLQSINGGAVLQYLYKGIDYPGVSVVNIFESDGSTNVDANDITLIYS